MSRCRHSGALCCVHLCNLTSPQVKTARVIGNSKSVGHTCVAGSTDSEVSLVPGGQRAAKRKRDSSQASSSVSSLPDAPMETTADQSLDNSEGEQH